MDSVTKMAKEEGDEELVLEMKLLRCDYYSRGRLPRPDLVIPLLKELAEEAEDVKNLQIRVRANSAMANFYTHYSKDPGRSLEHTLKAYYLVKDIPVEEFPNKMDLVGGVGGAYRIFGDFHTAKGYMLEAVALGPSYKTWFNININTNIGLIYMNQKRFDSAIHFFSKVWQIAREHNSPDWQAISQNHIGTAYYMQGLYEKAIPFLENAASATYPVALESASNALIKLADIHMQRGNDVLPANNWPGRETCYRAVPFHWNTCRSYIRCWCAGIPATATGHLYIAMPTRH